MVDLSAPNTGYLIMGLLSFWLPVLLYIGWMRQKASRLRQEIALLKEEHEAFKR
ncbi:MAG: hypothetical protein KDD73_12830 [Anaerolineales bacterium]|nr:hypothetical protein [Anaerolineales bacterium]MCB9127884.1 hypothetical protein [Ardenticatenales bacterium]MCB9171646.1 hypothetical protein [Ardenticatenales bacterium]